jgi:hypothetical protein
MFYYWFQNKIWMTSHVETMCIPAVLVRSNLVPDQALDLVDQICQFNCQPSSCEMGVISQALNIYGAPLRLHLGCIAENIPGNDNGPKDLLDWGKEASSEKRTCNMGAEHPVPAPAHQLQCVVGVTAWWNSFSSSLSHFHGSDSSAFPPGCLTATAASSSPNQNVWSSLQDFPIVSDWVQPMPWLRCWRLCKCWSMNRTQPAEGGNAFRNNGVFEDHMEEQGLL